MVDGRELLRLVMQVCASAMLLLLMMMMSKLWMVELLQMVWTRHDACVSCTQQCQLQSGCCWCRVPSRLCWLQAHQQTVIVHLPYPVIISALQQSLEILGSLFIFFGWWLTYTCNNGWFWLNAFTAASLINTVICLHTMTMRHNNVYCVNHTGSLYSVQFRPNCSLLVLRDNGHIVRL